MKNSFLNACLIILFIFNGISGCSLIPPSPPPPPSAAIEALWQFHRARLKSVNQWRLNGNISISTAEKNWRARIHWRQDKKKYTLRLYAPLGQGAMLLEGDEQKVIMRTADNKIYQAKNPDSLVREVLNLELPVSGLHFWILGLPSIEAKPNTLRLNETGQLHTLEQQGWQIQYLNYFDDDNIALPKKIYLENKDFEVTLVITDWEIEKTQISPPLLKVEMIPI
jgi:outer membrane lipoprotein LolB